MGISEELAIVDEVSKNPEALTAGDVGVIASVLSELQPQTLMNATVGLHMTTMSAAQISGINNFIFICIVFCLLSKVRDMVRNIVDNVLTAEERVLDEIGESSPTATRYAIIAHVCTQQVC